MGKHNTFFIFFIAIFCVLNAEEKPFVVVVPSYNNARWYLHNLDSIFQQDYSNYRVIYVDDASLDGTGSLVEKYIQKNELEERITLIKNERRSFCLSNLYKAIWQCQPNEIVVQLDGDDWFAHAHVLSHLNNVYADPEVWVTYGQFQYYPSNEPGWAAQVPLEVIENNTFRENNWTTTALRSFYAILFHQIHKDDLLYHGKFYPMAGDLAYMFPVVEMAGKHSRFIPEILYIYNVVTMINDGTIDRDFQYYLGLTVRDKKKYSPLEKLPLN